MDTKRILVVYATNAGSTGEVAQFIAKEFVNHGAEAEAYSVNVVDDMADYDAVVVGSPILYGRWMRDAQRFVQQRELTLGQKPVAFFTTCMRLGYIAGDPVPDVSFYVDSVFGGPTPKSELTMIQKSHPLKSYINPLLEMAPQINPVSIAIFRGKYIGSELGAVQQFVMWFTTLADGLKQGDYRNWESIREWVSMVYAQL